MMLLTSACIAANTVGARAAAIIPATPATDRATATAIKELPRQQVGRASLTKVPMLAFTAVSVLSRPRFLCCFTATGLACGEIKKRENNVHPNSSSGRKERQKKVDGRAAAEIASKQKHSPAKEQLVASSIFSSLDLFSGRVR